MVGAPLYPDHEIQWLLDHIIKGENASAIRTQFEDKFGRPLRKNQVRYIKNKYGKDPRFNSPLINRRPNKRAKGRPTRTVRRTLVEDSDDNAGPSKSAGRKEEDSVKGDTAEDAGAAKRPERDVKTKMEGQETIGPNPVTSLRPPNVYLESSQVEELTGSNAFLDPALFMNMSGWPDSMPSVNAGTGFTGHMPRSSYGNSTGTSFYGQQPEQWPFQSGGWNMAGSTLPPGIGYPTGMTQLFQSPMVQSRQTPIQSHGHTSLPSYALPIPQDMPMAFPSQLGYQSFHGPYPNQPNPGMGFQTQSMGYPAAFNESSLRPMNQPNLAISPELVAPSPLLQPFLLPSLQAVAQSTTSPHDVSQPAQQQVPSVLAGHPDDTQDSHLKWSPKMSTVPAEATLQTPASEPSWASALTPMLYGPPASSTASSNPSPSLTQDVYVDPWTCQLSGTPRLYHPSPPRAAERLFAGHDATLIAPSPGALHHPWYALGSGIAEDPALFDEHETGIKNESPLLEPRCLPMAAGHIHRGSFAETIDPTLVAGGPGILLSPPIKHESYSLDSYTEGLEDREAMFTEGGLHHF